jgi:hypothetical protein
MGFLNRISKKRDGKIGITHFGLVGHEVALFKSMIENGSGLQADCELLEPNRSAACDIVLVNKDSELARSWWKNYKKRNPDAVPLFLTDSKLDPDNNVYCKRPFLPSHLRSVLQDVVASNLRR